MYFQRGCLLDGGVYFGEVLVRNKENIDIKIKRDKDIESLSWLGEGIFTVLSSLILGTEKENKEVVLHTLKIKDKEKRLLLLFV